MKLTWPSRRVVLLSLAALAVPGALGGYAAVSTALRCAAQGRSGGALASVGAAYLAAIPEERDRRVLIARLRAETPTVLEALAKGGMDAALTEARQTLATGSATVACGGWVLGQAEARCAALVALERDAA
ncbi:MAG: hypothetical protein AAF416_01585 [Pseudomonadota bacterium]